MNAVIFHDDYFEYVSTLSLWPDYNSPAFAVVAF